MKSHILFFNTKLCSGCLLCEMTCSLIQEQECSREASFIKVHIHPYLSVPMVCLSVGCNCPDGEEKCAKMCNQKALTFVPREASTLKLTEEGDWFPSPLI